MRTSRWWIVALALHQMCGRRKVTEESGGTVERKKFRHRNVDKGPYTMDRHEKGDRGRPGAGAECYGQFGPVQIILFLKLANAFK